MNGGWEFDSQPPFTNSQKLPTLLDKHMTHSEVALLFTEAARGWIGRKSKESDTTLQNQLNRSGYTAFQNNYTLAFHNPHHPVVLIGGAKFLKAWSLPNPIIAVPQIDEAGEMDFLRHDERLQTVFLPARQIDFLDDVRVRVGNVDRPDFLEKLLVALNDKPTFVRPSTAAD